MQMDPLSRHDVASYKALDLLCDPCCRVHNTVSDRDVGEDEFRIYARALDVRGVETRRSYANALYENIGFRSEEPESRLFSFDIESAAYAFCGMESGSVSCEMAASQAH